MDVLSGWKSTATTNSKTQQGSDSRTAHTNSRRTSQKACDLLPSVNTYVSSQLPESVARQYEVVLIEVGDEIATVATTNVRDLAMQDKLSFVLAKKIQLVEVPRRLILQSLGRIYSVKKAILLIH